MKSAPDNPGWLLPLFCCVALMVFAPVATGASDSTTELDRAERLLRNSGPEAAVPVLREMLSRYQAQNDTAAIALATMHLGEAHWRTGDYAEAGELLSHALVLFGEQGDPLLQGRCLNLLGLLAWDLGKFDTAEDRFARGSEFANTAGDRQLAGAILNNLSLVHDELGEYYVSLQQYQRVLQLYEGQDFPRGEGDTLGNIGGVYLLLGRYPEALNYYGRALQISEQLQSSVAMSQDHGNSALALLGLGRLDDALARFDRAIALAKDAGMRQDEAYWLCAKGRALMLAGRYDLSLDLQHAGLAIYRELDGRTELVDALYDMGELLRLLGDIGGASEYFEESMQVARSIGQARGVNLNLIALGDLYSQRGDLEAARAFYEQAVDQAAEAGTMALWATGLLRLAEAHRLDSHPDVAAAQASEAYRIARETGAAGLESQALYAMAEADRQSGRHSQAQERYRQVIARLVAAPDSELAWRAYYGAGRTLAAEGRIGGAVAALQQAIEVIEGVRDHLRQERFRAGYVQDKYQVYIDLIHLQLQSGSTGEAFSTAERLRSRSYFNLIEDMRMTRTGSGDEAEDYALQSRIRALRRALMEEQNRERPEQRQPAISVYTQELLDAEQSYQVFLDDRRQRPHGDYRAVPGYAEVGARLASGEALVEYVVGQDDLILFLLTPDSLTSRSISLRRADLDNKVELLRNLVARRDPTRWQKPAASLAQSLIDPLTENDLLDGVRHLYVVPHGMLNYLPFALLPVADGKRLVERYTLAYLPTAAALLQPSPALESEAPMLVMAPGRSGLKHAQSEAAAVNALFGPGSTVLLGEEATETAFKRDAANFGHLHLATHGYFNKFNPMFSGLELEADGSNDGRLDLYEILDLRLDADLVTLSACQTGLGSGHFAEVPAGDEFVGLTRAFLYAGSASVLATLWKVDDASTSDLMKSFYGELNHGSTAASKALALARAQRTLLASAEYRHPFFWAPFVLVGEALAGQSAKS